jgi:hypothetical protein
MADRGAELGELIRLEHASVPPGAWGFFFPVTLAVWRLLQAARPTSAGEVHAFWTDGSIPVENELEVFGSKYLARRGTRSYDYCHGPVFAGPGGQWLMEVLENPDVLDAVEGIAYTIPQSVGRERVRAGIVALEDIPPPDRVLVARLQLALECAIAVPGSASSKVPKS